MNRIRDAFISPFQLSKQSIQNLKYFGVTDLIAVPQIKNVDTSEQLIDYFQSIISDVERLQSWGIQAISTLGIRGKKPKRAGDSIFVRLSELTEQNGLKAIGPIGIMDDSEPDWDVFDKQISIAGKLDLPLIVAAPAALEVTATYKMANVILEKGLSPEKCIFRVRDPILVEPLLKEGFCCAVTAAIQYCDFLPLLQIDGASNRLQICSDIESNHQDLLVIPKLKDRLIRDDVCKGLIERILFENSTHFYLF